MVLENYIVVARNNALGSAGKLHPKGLYPIEHDCETAHFLHEIAQGIATPHSLGDQSPHWHNETSLSTFHSLTNKKIRERNSLWKKECSYNLLKNVRHYSAQKS